MDAAELVELAAAISVEAVSLLDLPGGISTNGLAAYWAASKCRQQRWSARLKTFRQRSLQESHHAQPGKTSSGRNRSGEPQSSEPQQGKLPPGKSQPAKSQPGKMQQSASQWWRSALPLCREVLASEILTRVCAGFWAVFDRQRVSHDAEPLARSIWIGHLEARHSVLNLLASGRGLPPAEAESLDRLRRTAERWSDLLLAPLLLLADVTEFAHDLDRLGDYAQDAAEERRSKSASTAQRLWSRSRGGAFASCRRLATFNADLNAQIAGGILDCFNFEACDESSVPGLAAISRSLLCERLIATTTDAQLWIAGLLSPGNERLTLSGDAD
jgi:hypothetical protein